MNLSNATVRGVFIAGAVSVLLVCFFSLLTLAYFSPSKLPAVATLYNNDAYSWLSPLSFALLLGCSACSFTTSVVVAWDAFMAVNKRSRWRGLLLSIAFMSLALWFFTITGILLFGGAWHLAAITTGSVLATALLAFTASSLYEHYQIFCKHRYSK